MNGPRSDVLALFPGALGDLLCCWPALAALQRLRGSRLTLAAREAWFPVLPEGACTLLSIDRREFAHLFGAAPVPDATRALCAGFAEVESWTGYGDDVFARRLSEACQGARIRVHPFRRLRPGEHASDYYARCLGVAPRVDALPVRTAAAVWAEAFWQRHAPRHDALVIHPGSGSARKNWEGMAEVAATWQSRGRRVISLTGPAEDGQSAAIPSDVAVCGEPLDRIAALLARASRYLGNDSGISHLAGAVGGHGLALFGPTDPRAWRPLGPRIGVLSAADECRRCGADRFCVHRLPVDRVLAALSAMGDRTPP
jgi:hypothetical protein